MPPKRKAASSSTARKKAKSEVSSEVWAVFLRGVNIGSGNRIAMDELRDCLETAGYGPVKTVVQSGNIVLRAGADTTADDVREGVAKALEPLGLETHLVLRSKADLLAVLEHDPYKDVADNQSKYLIHLFATGLSDDDKAKLLKPFEDDAENQAVFHGQELYMWCPNGISKSPWFKTKFDKLLPENAGTARNWRTISAVAKLM